MNVKELDQTYVANTYHRFPLQIVRGKGSVVEDENGKQYIDLGTGIGVNNFGIGDEAWKQAVIDQMNKFQHTSNLYYTEPCVTLARMLCERTGMKKVFFSNSRPEIRRRPQGAGVPYHRHPDQQLPRQDHHHLGRHRPG